MVTYFLSSDCPGGDPGDNREFKTRAGADRAAAKLLNTYGWSHSSPVHAVFVHQVEGKNTRVVAIWHRDEEDRIVLDRERMQRAGFAE